MVTESGGKRHVVVIAEDHREDVSPYIVVPGRLAAAEGDEIFFKNVTGDSVTVSFLGDSPVGDSTIPL